MALEGIDSRIALSHHSWIPSVGSKVIVTNHIHVRVQLFVVIPASFDDIFHAVKMAHEDDITCHPSIYLPFYPKKSPQAGLTALASPETAKSLARFWHGFMTFCAIVRIYLHFWRYAQPVEGH